MSRIGKQVIPIPEKVEVTVEGRRVSIKGVKGELVCELPSQLSVVLQDHTLSVARNADEPRVRALHGLYRALLHNSVLGVSEGFSKRLELHGVGYRAMLQGKDLHLSLGFSKPVIYIAPLGITFSVEGTERIIVSGIDKQFVGQVAAEIRSIRPVEPYKGKGVRYLGEKVLRKAGKAAKGAAGAGAKS